MPADYETEQTLRQRLARSRLSREQLARNLDEFRERIETNHFAEAIRARLRGET